MNIAYVKKKLQFTNIALFEVNNDIIKWKNKYFNYLFDFLDKDNLENKLTLKYNNNNYFLNLLINKENIQYKSDLLIKNNKNNIYKINDNQIKKILALKDGMECFKSGSIKFALQKQYNLNYLTISGYEYLARMYLKDGTLVSNENFMPIINSNYQLNILLPCVLKRISLLKENNRSINWINVSAELLEAKTFYKNFINLVKKFKLNSKNIGIEITESHKIISNNEIIGSLLKLKKAKFLIAMDDFGSGYANIRRLSYLPVDLVKLDKSFIADIKNKKTQTLIKGIVEMGINIGYSVLAEGIEKKSELSLAKMLGVKYGQGWYIGKPKIL